MNEPDFPGRLLHQACVWENAELLEDLLKNGEEVANVNAEDKYGRTALHLAAGSGNSSLVAVLLTAGAQPNVQSSLRAGAETPLHLAAYHGRLEAVAGLLSAGAMTDISNGKGQTPLDVAVERKQRDCSNMLSVYQEAKAERLEHNRNEFNDAFLRNDIERVGQVLDHVGNDCASFFQSIDIEGLPVLLRAVSNNDVEMVRVLLSKGADANVSTKEGNTLHEATFRGNQEIVKLLLTTSPGLVTKTNNLGWLPLHVAVSLQHRHIVDNILNHHYPDECLQPFTDSSMMWNYKMPFDINAVTTDQQTSLYLAVDTSNVRLVEQLLAKKVAGRNSEQNELAVSPLHLDLPSYNGETALYAAVKNKNQQITTLLLDHGAPVNTEIFLGTQGLKSTALATAVGNNDLRMVVFLLSRGATDVGHFGLSAAVVDGISNEILTRILALHSHRDTEFKINKKLMELASAKGIRQHSSPSGSLTYSAIFPTVPVAVNWQGTHSLTKFDESWLSHSSSVLNQKVAGGMTLYAITKLDVSDCALEELPTSVFRLQSLRMLNASHNKISRFSSLDLCRNPSSCQCPVLQEVVLSHNNLVTAPDDLFYFPALVSLDLSYNAIQNLPWAIWQAPVLKDLNLSHNCIESLPLRMDKMSGVFSPERTVSQSNISSGSNSSLTAQESEADVSKRSEMISQPVHRKNLWGSRLVLETVQRAETKTDKNLESAMKNLNLDYNALTSVPLGLSCLVPNLSRLILSHNCLKSMGIVQDMPAGIKHLELVGNALEEAMRPGMTEEVGCVCYSDDSSWHKGRRSVVLETEQPCIHRRHWRLDNLRTLIVSQNMLPSFEVTGSPPAKKGSRTSSGSGGRLNASANGGQSLLYPNLSVLDVSSNRLSEVPVSYSNMSALSILNLENNVGVSDIPPQLGLLPKLWTLNAHGCNLTEPLKSMLNNKQYKTADILGYLKSSLENCQPYTRLKLMFVGLENKGKTSLLKALKNEESTRKRPSSAESSNWTQRMTQKNSRSSVQLSTVGIDLGEWTYNNGANDFTFRTWDFAGQREYYATHQYFLSKRSIYLVVWNMLDGLPGIREITQWLVNIQARAPSSPVIIVGTHLDEVKGAKGNPDYAEELKREVRHRFVGVIDADKHGLPRIVGCVEVNCKNKTNVPQLAKMVADAAWDMRSPGTQKRLMEQQVPAIYIALEDLVNTLAQEYRDSGQHPVVTTEYFRAIIAHELHERFDMTFRDSAELRQAVMFLHDNGILLHYEDSGGLKDLYFLDPQWLCDTLASVITVREINPFVRKGIMKVDDLKVLFKPSKYALIDIHTYILSLLNKFEVALKLDARTLLIPSLLPIKRTNMDGTAHDNLPLKIEIKSSGRNWIHFKPYLESPEEPSVSMDGLGTDASTQIRRYYTMLYFPSGFWSRLISRLISDEKFWKDLRGYYSEEGKSGLAVEWLCWQNALELRFGNNPVLKLKELAEYNNRLPEKVMINHDANWRTLSLHNKAIMEIKLPLYSKGDIVVSSVASVSMLLNRCVSHIDALLEDWYPSLGTRFIHTSTGQLLITKFTPCPSCLTTWMSNGMGEGASDGTESEVRVFSVEQMIYRAVTGYDDMTCSAHGGVKLRDIAPETMFLDLPIEKLLFPGDLKRGRILGRGAFGFVYKASVKAIASRAAQEVAVKMLLPVDPGFGSDPAVLVAYKSALQQWEHDPLQSYCKAYWTARQELSILTSLSHHNIVGLVGLCMQPLGIVLQLAPKGSLLEHLKNLRQSSDKLSAISVQQICSQISKALEYLHGFRIIYRDLKSDNVLVWSIEKKVMIKLTDYGISRAVTAASTTKGFAGTEAYIAPEIIQYGGEEEYNEAVDVFSFGMLMYELLTLKQPFDGQDQVKDVVLDGGRPPVTSWTLTYPSLILDLLVIAWSQSPKDRPSSSQVLSICNTPELSHLQDVAMLEDVGLAVVPGGIFMVADAVGIVLREGTINIVSCTSSSWTDSRVTSAPLEDEHVSHVLALLDFIWLLRGRTVSVYCSKTLEIQESFAITFGNAAQEGDVLCWVYNADRQRVVVALSSNRLLVLNSHASLRKNKLVENFCRIDIPVYELTFVSKETIWAAGDGGQVVVVHIRDDGIAQDYILQHPDTSRTTAKIVGSPKEHSFAWTYLENDGTLHCWTLLKPQVVHKLDCERLIPVSESLDSIGIDETSRDDTKRHLSAMVLFEGLLYVGTVWGSLIVVESHSLNPLSVIRPHADRILAVLPLRSADGSDRVITVGQGYRDVISRFFNHDNLKQSVSPLTLCAVLWRTNDWALS